MNEALRAPSPPPKRHTPGHCSFTGENKRIIFLHTFLKAFWLLSRSDTTLLHPAAECWSCAPASFKSHVLQPAKRLCRDFSHYMVLRLRHTWKCICTYDWTSAQDDLLLPLWAKVYSRSHLVDDVLMCTLTRDFLIGMQSLPALEATGIRVV